MPPMPHAAARDAAQPVSPGAPVPTGGPLPWSWLAALAGVSLLLDLALAPVVMGEGDAAEFTLTLALGGVPHPTGYPLYSLAGHAFVRLLHSLGCGWAFAANLWSVAGAALAALFTAALADRAIPESVRLARPARLVLVVAGLAALAANPVFLRAATQAEVYSWQTAWAAAISLVTLEQCRALARGGRAGATRVRTGALAWGALAGAGLSNHLTAAFLVAPLSLALGIAAVRARRLDATASLAAAVGAAFPLLSYGFVAWRALHPAPGQWEPLEPTAASVIAHVSGSVYRAYLGGFHPGEAERALLLRCVLPVAAPGLLAALAAAWSARRAADGPALAALLASCVLQAGFTLRYGVEDPSFYFLPVIVVSVAVAARLAAAPLSRLARPLPAALVAFAGMALVALAWVPPEFGHARRIAEVDRGVREAFRALPFRRGIVVWHSDAYVRLRAHQLLDGEQTGLVVVNPAVLTWAPARRARARELGFDPLAGMKLESDADLAGVAANIARQTPLPVVDFAAWWERFRTQSAR